MFFCTSRFWILQEWVFVFSAKVDFCFSAEVGFGSAKVSCWFCKSKFLGSAKVGFGSAKVGLGSAKVGFGFYKIRFCSSAKLGFVFLQK